MGCGSAALRYCGYGQLTAIGNEESPLRVDTPTPLGVKFIRTEHISGSLAAQVEKFILDSHPQIHSSPQGVPVYLSTAITERANLFFPARGMHSMGKIEHDPS